MLDVPAHGDRAAAGIGGVDLALDRLPSSSFTLTFVFRVGAVLAGAAGQRRFFACATASQPLVGQRRGSRSKSLASTSASPASGSPSLVGAPLSSGVKTSTVPICEANGHAAGWRVRNQGARPSVPSQTGRCCTFPAHSPPMGRPSSPRAVPSSGSSPPASPAYRLRWSAEPSDSSSSPSAHRPGRCRLPRPGSA